MCTAFRARLRVEAASLPGWVWSGLTQLSSGRVPDRCCRAAERTARCTIT